MLTGKRILLIISGGIAAYKSITLIRLLKKSGASVRCIITNGGKQFVTPLSVAAISEENVYDDIWSLKDETEMGHIRLSREADLVLVTPASANLIAQMAHGLAEDLASTTLLATNRPVMICPAMNPMMWQHAATQDNLETLEQRGIHIIPPADGDMACGENGTGRLPEPEDILERVIDFIQHDKPLAGKRAIVTSGPTFEPIDPVRFVGNRSSGKQGHAIAKSLADAGAAVTLISGPVSIVDPKGVETVHIETAEEMLNAVTNSLPADIAVCAAAVSDWRVESCSAQKIKKGEEDEPPTFTMVENPDILRTISQHPDKRPTLVIGFAAETENLIENAIKKQAKKGCDWILANNVGEEDIFGAATNHVFLLENKDTITEWSPMDKEAVATELTNKIVKELKNDTENTNCPKAA